LQGFRDPSKSRNKKSFLTWLRGSEAAANDEPAVHITYDEAQAFCRWAGGRLLNDAQWLEAAYTERRSRGGTARRRCVRTISKASPARRTLSTLAFVA